MKRVYFLTGEFPPMRGGMGDYTRELARALAREGWDVHVITHVKARPPSGTDAARAVTVHPVVRRWTWRGVAWVIHLLRRLPPAILHIQYQTAAYGMHPAVNVLPWLLRRLAPGWRLALTYHDLRVPYLFPKAGPLRRWITLFPARHVDWVVTTNVEDEMALKRAGIPSTRIPIGANVHPHPVSPEEVHAARQRWGIPEGAWVVGYFGFLNRSKGVTDLLDAVARLVDTGQNVHLLMMGEPLGASDPTNRAYMEEVTARVAILGLEDRVHWTGFLTDRELSAGFALTHVVALPYRDGVSLRRGTLHAALVHGATIVTTQPRLPIPELESAVELVPPGDVAALAEALERLLQDEERRAWLAHRARELSRTFTWDAIARRHIEMYSRPTPYPNLDRLP